MDSIEMKLWCILEGKKVVFPVKLKGEASVAELKDAIYAILPNALRMIDAVDMRIWKIHNSRPEAQLLSAADFDDAQEPGGRDRIRDYWTDLSGDIHVFIANPVGETTKSAPDCLYALMSACIESD